MNNLSDAQYTQLQSKINVMPWEMIKNYLNWTYQGRALTVNDFPQANDSRKAQIRDFLNQPRPNPIHDMEWADLRGGMDRSFDEMMIHELQAFELKLKRYIANWEISRPYENHVDDAITKLSALQNHIEEEEWKKVDLFDIASLENYYRKYLETIHKNDIDDTIFSLSKGKPVHELINALLHYKQIFPQGNHVEEADRMIEAVRIWLGISASRDLVQVFSYIKSYPDSPFIDEAKLLMIQLKAEEIAIMKREFMDYSRDKLLNFIKTEIFTENELIYAQVVTRDSLEILRNYSEIRESLPVLDNIIPRCKTECYADHTDVFLFGIPATGKSCVLAGLIGSNILNYDSVSSGGAYADALIEFMNNSCPPPPTKKNYLTTIKAWIKNGDIVHPYNLIEMAGEEFADKISLNPDGEVCFEDMGTGAADLLNSDNDKIFFIIVDPTKDFVRFKTDREVKDKEGNIIGYETKEIVANQVQCMKRMIDMFNKPENENVMKKVKAIHFVVTKSDTLGDTLENRLDGAVAILDKKYSLCIETLYDIFENPDYDINRATGYKPMVYTFSLGKFYVGNIFEYDSSDSANLIEVMQGNVVGIKKETFFDKMRRLFN